MAGEVIADHRRDPEGGAPLGELARLPGWVWTRLQGGGPLTDCRPWVNYRTLDYLQQQICPGLRVFEWGAGGSTCFLLRQGVSLVSVEHDPQWSQSVESALRPLHGTEQWTLHQLPPDPLSGSVALVTPDNEIAESRSRAPGFENHSFARYVGAIQAYPDAHFDWIIVDGRARPACLIAARDKVRPGGMLMLDNSDRDYYHEAMRRLSPTFTRLDLRGLCAHALVLTTTTLWFRTG